MTERPSLDDPEHRVALLVGALAIAAGLSVAAWMAWTCDDAFVSYRYARNLVRGSGLVFNEGERVEGYTNLLWTLWVALGMVLSVSAETWSTIWGIACHGATMVLLLVFHAELRRRLPVSRFTLPIACIAFAVHPDCSVFATSGLETSAFTLFAFAGYTVVASGIVTRRARPVLAGALFGCALLLRPDGALFAGLGFAAVLVTSERRVRDALLFASAAGTFWASATAFRVSYYGEWVPNTYYAKSAYLSWHEQGLLYLWAYLQKYWVLFAGAAAALPVLRRAWVLRATKDLRDDFWAVHAALALVFAAAYTYYVVRVGGDFMYARLLVPVTPYFAVLAELGLYRVSLQKPVVYVELVLAGLLVMVLTPRPTQRHDWLDGIADEHSFYDEEEVVREARETGALSRYLHDLPVRVAFMGAQAREMYEADIPVAIEAETGLTDATIARQPLAKRGRVGHEKRADTAYLVKTRRTHFVFVRKAPVLLSLASYIPVVPIKIDSVEGYVLHWDPKLMRTLAARGAEFEDFPATLDAYVATLGTRPREEVARDYARFRHFYFDGVPDPDREAAFERALGRRTAGAD